MSDDKILDQDEIDALIHGVDIGSVKTDAEPAAGEGGAIALQGPLAAPGVAW